MIRSKKLLDHIVNRINNLSRYYTAEIPKEPRKYIVMTDDTPMVYLKRGILIRRYEDARGLPTEAFIFEPDIMKAIRKRCRSDEKFREKVKTLELKGYDIEHIVFQITDCRISLGMKRKYDY